MKNNRALLISLALMIFVAALYRIIPGRPWGFAPQIAMALFGGAVIKDRKWAFALPIFSMFLSDCLYEILFRNGLTTIQGFLRRPVHQLCIVCRHDADRFPDQKDQPGSGGDCFHSGTPGIFRAVEFYGVDRRRWLCSA